MKKKLNGVDPRRAASRLSVRASGDASLFLSFLEWASRFFGSDQYSVIRFDCSTEKSFLPNSKVLEDTMRFCFLPCMSIFLIAQIIDRLYSCLAALAKSRCAMKCSRPVSQTRFSDALDFEKQNGIMWWRSEYSSGFPRMIARSINSKYHLEYLLC